MAEVRTECNKRLEKVGLKIEKRTSETSGKKEFVLITLIQDAGKMLCQDPSLKYEDFMPYARGNIFKHFPSGSSHKADENLMMCPRRFIDLLKIHLFSIYLGLILEMLIGKLSCDNGQTKVFLTKDECRNITKIIKKGEPPFHKPIKGMLKNLLKYVYVASSGLRLIFMNTLITNL